MDALFQNRLADGTVGFNIRLDCTQPSQFCTGVWRKDLASLLRDSWNIVGRDPPFREDFSTEAEH
jgi:hypothetical protein